MEHPRIPKGEWPRYRRRVEKMSKEQLVDALLREAQVRSEIEWAFELAAGRPWMGSRDEIYGRAS